MTYQLQARSATRDVWVHLQRDGQPSRGPWQLADGSAVRDLIADGEIARLGFVPRFVRANRGTRVGDLLWTMDLIKIASRRFIETLQSINATGYRTFPVEVVKKDGTALGDFEGFAVLDNDPAHDLQRGGFQTFRFLANDRVVEALRAAGATDLEIKPTV